MANEKHHIVNLSNKGIFQQSGDYQTQPADVDAIFDELERLGANHLALYFHGGLVSEATGLETARRLLTQLQNSGAYPVFFVWESGLKETVWENLKTIADEPIFKRLLEWVLKFVIGKITEQPGARGLTLDLPPTDEIRTELQGEQPFAAYDEPTTRQNLIELTPDEIKQFQEKLEGDMRIEDQVVEILDSIQPAPTSEEESEEPQPNLTSEQTQLSSEVLEKLQEDNPDGSRGIITTATLAKMGVAILARAIKRLIKKTDHGIYTTVIEEILRELYADQIGAWVWNRMKTNVQYAFVDNAGLSGAALHGGTYFLEKLNAHLAIHPDFKVSLIGHSAGGIYICRFVEKATSLIPEIKFHQVIMLAPGCNFDLFQQTVLSNKDKLENFRMFALGDALESTDAIASVAYPKSLLYFVSGLLEGDAEKPIIGMQRFYSGAEPYDTPEIANVRAYINTSNRAIWSKSTGQPPGDNCEAETHGGLDDDTATIESIITLLK